MKKLIMVALVCVVLASLILAPAIMADEGKGEAKKANEGRIELFQKDPVTGQPVPGGGQAKLRFNLAGPTFNFVLNSKGLKPDTSYSLIYYAEEQPGIGTGILLASSTSDSSGKLHLFGSRDLKMSLPYPKDINYARGAKIWLVPSSDYDTSNKKLKAMRPSDYLFESNTIRYEYQAAAEITKAAAEVTKLVSLFFDDGWQNQYDVALPVLRQHNFKATFCVITRSIGTGEGFWKYMNTTELNALANDGMDIASHTRTHPDLTELTTGDLQDEIMGSKSDLEGLGFQVRTFAYPYFEYNEAAVSCVKEAGYICARAGGLGNPYYLGTTDPNEKYYVDCYCVTNENLDGFKAAVSQASSDAVICLCYHFISDTGPAETSTPVANFYEQMSYLKETGFTVALLPDLIQAPSPTIAFSPTSLTFTGTQGGSNPATQTLNISNSGGGTLNWTASSDVTWLSLTPTSGSSTGPQNPVTVSTDITGLSAGTHNGTITISASDATNTPQTVPVTLTVQAPSSNWLTGWNYRKQITIAGSTAGAQTNYQMKLTINRSTGTDSGSTVYVGTNCASDYQDIRFTKNDGTTLLDYWLESSNSSTATVWVEFDSIPASTNTANFFLYYGNSGATSSSNIQNTFVFADDFEDGALDTTNRWTTGGGTGGSVTEANGVLTATAGPSNQKYAASINTYNNAYALHARAKLDSITSCSSFRLIGFRTTKGTYTISHFTSAFRWHYTTTTFYAISGNGKSTSYANMNVARDTNYHISECRRFAASGTNYDRFIIDGGSAISGTYPTTTSRYIYINSDEHGKAIIVDWIFLRKFVSPEPTWGTWGSEETH